MNWKILKNKKIYISAILAAIYWVIALYVFPRDYFFTYSETTSVRVVWGFRFLFFFYLWFHFFLGCVIWERRKEPMTRLGIRCGLCFLLLSAFFLMILWPGTFSWDDIGMLGRIKVYQVYCWQHIITWIWQTLATMTIPIASGLVIMQLLQTSVIAGYCIARTCFAFWQNEKSRKIAAGVLFVAFLMPGILLYLFSGWRMLEYSFLELLLFVELIVCYKERQEVPLWHRAMLVCAAILVTTWRTEGFFYILIFPLALFLATRAFVKRKQWVRMVLLFLVGVLCVTFVNKAPLKWTARQDYEYEFVATMLQVTALVRAADSVTDADLLEDINLAANIDAIYENPELGGEALYAGKELMRKNVSAADYQKYRIALVKLALRHPKAFLNERWMNFARSMGWVVCDGISEQRNIINRTAFLWDGGFSAGYDSWVNDVDSHADTPLFDQLRSRFVLLLGCVNKDYEVYPWYFIFWNLGIPMAVLLWRWIVGLKRRNAVIGLLGVGMIARIAIIFLTSPAPYFMYFLSLYLIGWYLLLFLMAQKFVK